MNKILELIYPNVCGFCGQICKDSLCGRCKVIIKKYETNIEYFSTRDKYFDDYANIFRYEGMIRDKILEYKFGNKAYLYKTFTKTIINNKKVCGFIEKYDIIVAVPVHKKRRIQRGYNQVELIAKEIAKCKGINFEKNILLKKENTVSQSTLTKGKREENVRHAFGIREKEFIVGKKVLLLDDIYTTGSTVNECSRIIKRAGAKSIGVLTIAKD